nr:RICIN domain-containing protein [Herpetosiphonaceae bacterium]
VRLVARHSNKVFDVSGSGTADGTNIQQWTWNGSNAQRFTISN